MAGPFPRPVPPFLKSWQQARDFLLAHPEAVIVQWSDHGGGYVVLRAYATDRSPPYDAMLAMLYPRTLAGLVKRDVVCPGVGVHEQIGARVYVLKEG